MVESCIIFLSPFLHKISEPRNLIKREYQKADKITLTYLAFEERREGSQAETPNKVEASPIA